jgi:hypothetical protein
MRLKSILVVGVALIITAKGIVNSGCAHLQRSSSSIQESRDLHLIIRSNQKVFTIGDTLIVTLKFKNVGDKPLGICYFQTYESKLLTILSPKGKKIIGKKTAVYKWANPTFPLILPDSSFTRDIEAIVTRNLELRFSDMSYKLRNFGKYKISASFESEEASQRIFERYGRKFEFDRVWMGKVESDTLEIEIVDVKESGQVEKVKS